MIEMKDSEEKVDKLKEHGERLGETTEALNYRQKYAWVPKPGIKR